MPTPNQSIPSSIPPPSYSTAEWPGIIPQKFKSNRKHDNHPIDMLNNLLMNSDVG
jgi:hypothetical protein